MKSLIQPTGLDEVKFTQEQIDEVKKMLGAEAILVVATKESHECDPKLCVGHKIPFHIEGFTPGQAGAIGERLLELAIKAYGKSGESPFVETEMS